MLGAEMERLIQVVYFSDRVESPGLGETSDIIRVIESKHAALGITGFLFALGGWFISVLEGDHDRVLSRMEQLASDPSHQRMVVPARGCREQPPLCILEKQQPGHGRQ